MERGDRALELVRTRSPGAERAVQDGEALVDHRVVPPGPVLVLEQDHRPQSIGSGVAPRMLQEHQREQAPYLGFVRHQRHDEAGQADRLVTQVRSNELAGGRGVSLVEDQVQDGEHARQAFGQELGGRDTVGDRRLPDLALGPNEALGHRRLRDEEGTGDLAGREAAEGLQRQRNSRVHPQGRVAAREDQPQPVVGDPAHVRLVSSERLERLHDAELRRLLTQRPLTPEPVDRAVARGRRDPRAGVVGDPALGPDPHGLCERLLHRVLGEVEISQDPDQGRDRSTLLAPEQAVDDGGGRGPYDDGRPSSSKSMTGRISTEPSSPTGIFALASIASSRLGQSTR